MTDRMRDAWDRRADSDALTAIESSRKDWTRDEFFEDGRRTVEQVLGWVETDDIGRGRGRVLKIGCGLGRTAVAFAAHFEHVDGVDVSPRMVEQAGENGLPSNVELQATSGADLGPFDADTFDLVFSEHVFQHVPDAAAIEQYIEETARVLKPGGAALLQFDTRPRTAATKLIELVPDRLLPRERRRHMRRYRRDAGWIRERVAAAGLAVEWERGERTHWHWLLLRRPPA
jgi:SAM-dependent methyltransferase